MTFKSPTPKWTIPPAQVNSVAITDDGSQCVYGSSYERGQGYFYTYSVDNQGNQLWKQPIVPNQKTYQGVYWVDISGDGQWVASGGETVDYQQNPNASDPGFLQAFKADTGEMILNVTRPSRINQVSLSQDGQYLAVCYGKTVEIFMLHKGIKNPGEFVWEYISLKQFTSQTHSMNSCEISRNGTTVVAAGIAWPSGDTTTKTSSDTTTGMAYSYTISDQTAQALGQCPTPVGCMRVAVTADGDYWGGSLHNGQCFLIHHANPNNLLWQCDPNISGLELAYAATVTKTESNEVYLACGANLHRTQPADPGGVLYLVKNTLITMDQDGIADGYPAETFEGVVQWSQTLDFGVNPGVSMDQNATYVTAADGKPVGQTTTESAGNLYLFQNNGTSCTQLIKQATFMMNWPMQISWDGSAVVGASDDGTVYYWQAPYTSAG